MKFSHITILAILLSACNKYLDKPGDPTKRIPGTLADVEMMLDASKIIGPVCIGTDEFVVPPAITLTPDSRNYYLTWTPNDPVAPLTESIWQAPYGTVFNANLCLEVLAKIERNTSNEALYDRLKGSALFFRAAALTSVAWQFAKSYNESTSKNEPGIVLDLNSDPLEKLQRANIEDSYTQIIRDAEAAVQLLPMYSSHATRPSRLAAYGLLARVYLSMRKYDKVLQYCNSFLDQQAALIDYNNPALINPAIGYPLAPHRWGTEVILSIRAPIGISLTSFPKCVVDSNIYNAFSNNDIRKKAWFRPSLGYHVFKGSYLSSAPHSSICTPEIYLMRAECFARDNQVQKAMDDLNELLRHRCETASFVPLEASGKEEALALVLTERKKELLFLGLRWMDIKRLNEEGANISITRKLGDQTVLLSPHDPRFAMQLPQFLVNTYGYIQNPVE